MTLLHSVQGRFRITHSLLKGNPPFAERMRRDLSNREGVLNVKASPVTGNFTVIFDDAKISPLELLHFLESHYADHDPASPEKGEPSFARSPLDSQWNSQHAISHSSHPPSSRGEALLKAMKGISTIRRMTSLVMNLKRIQKDPLSLFASSLLWMALRDLTGIKWP